MRFPPRICATLLGIAVAVVLPLAGVLVIRLLTPSAARFDLPLHSLLETMGGVLALAIAAMLVAKQRHGESAPHWTWTACALVGMGTLDLFHAAVQPGDNFVWLHSNATLVGGLFFLGVWLRRPVSLAWTCGLPAGVFLAALVFGLISCAWPALVPAMIESGRFTVTARMLNIVGGVGVGLASLFFVRRFLRGGRRDDWLFAVTTQLFAGAGILFELSAVWDAAWWWWHLLRLVAYGSACTFAVSKYLATESELHALNRRLTDLNRGLDQMVEDRTAELRASEERFALAVRGSTDGLWDWNVVTDEVYYSPRFKELLGCADDELDNVFASFESRLHPEDRERTLAVLQAHLEKRGDYDVEYRLHTKARGFRWFRARGQALWDTSGRPTRMAGSITDVTEQKRLQQRFQLAVEASPAALLMMDADGTIVLVNSECLRMFGYAREALLGQAVECLVAERCRDAFLAFRQASLDAARAPATEVGRDLYGLRRDGAEFPVEIGLAPVETEDSLTVIAGILDVTERRRVLAALQSAKEAAETANRAKSEFLANMSHEIRTPLNAVLGISELVLDTKLDDRQHELMAMVLESGESLLGIINEILDFSKIEAGKVELEKAEFSLRDLLGDTMKSLAFRAARKNLELAFHVHPDVPESLLGDPARLRQVVLNLVGNAIKFTEAGEIVVRVACRTPVAGQLELQCDVTDTGIGIPADKQGAIFAAFTQADGSTTRRFGGTGLGLSICVRLLELMGGHIWVESQLGRGSTFHFTARFGFASATSQAAPAVAAEMLRQVPVLIVDDNATNRLILEETVRHWDMESVLAAGGQEALEQFDQRQSSNRPFRLLLTDVQMPEMDGYMLCQQIRQRPGGADLAIIMLTSGVRNSHEDRVQQLGLAAQLIKPVKPSELRQVIGTVLAEALPGMRAGASRRAPPVQVPALRPLRILLAEDSLLNQKLAVGLLTKWGHTVTVANNGQEALTAVAEQTFDLVLMDVQMPEMDGLEATEEIRRLEQERGGHLPVVALTAHALQGDRERCLEAGMDAYVSKPIRQDELYEALAACCQSLADSPGPAVVRCA